MKTVWCVYERSQYRGFAIETIASIHSTKKLALIAAQSLELGRGGRETHVCEWVVDKGPQGRMLHWRKGAICGAW